MKNYDVVLRTVLQGENKTEKTFDSENVSIRDFKNISTQFNTTHVFDSMWLVFEKGNHTSSKGMRFKAI